MVLSAGEKEQRVSEVFITGMMTGCVSTVTLCDMSASTEQVRRGELNIFHMMIEIHTPNVS